MQNTTLDFPDINKAFIGATSLSEVCYNYIDILSTTYDIFLNQYSNKLLEFIDIDSKIPILEEEFHEFKLFLLRWSKQNNVKVHIKTRRKSWIGFNAKIRLFLSHNEDLNAVRDLLGFRLILCTNAQDSSESVKLCYQLMKDVLIFFATKRKSLLLNAEKKLGNPLDPNSEVAKKIFLYSKNDLPPELEPKVKNYIALPKDNGYQGLHGYVKTPSGLVFEIQVRTLAMELFDQSIHETHKTERYSKTKINLDYSIVNIPGVVFDSDNNLICDLIGLVNSIDNIFNYI